MGSPQDETIGITQIAFDMGAMIPSLLSANKVTSVVVYTPHYFGSALADMMANKEYRIRVAAVNNIDALQSNMRKYPGRAFSH